MKINISAALELGIWGFFLGIILALIVFLPLNLLAERWFASFREDLFVGIVFATTLAFMFWGAKSTPKVSEEFISAEGLTSREKVNAFLLSLTLPGAMHLTNKYYNLRKKYPVKARQLNIIIWLSLLVELILLVGLGLFLEWAIPHFFGQETYKSFLRMLSE
jgi:hypothetical protein